MRPINLVVVALLICLAGCGSQERISSYFSPNGGAEAGMIKEIGKAKQELRIAMYFFTEKDLAEAVVEAKKRGIDVAVLLDKTQENRKDGRIKLMREAGIPVYIDTIHNIMHNKFAVIDRETVITGSQNWTETSDTRNAENILIITGNRELAARYLAEFKELSHQARLLPVDGGGHFPQGE